MTKLYATIHVTLCGLFVYREWQILMNDSTQGYGNTELGIKFVAGRTVCFWPEGIAPKSTRLVYSDAVPIAHLAWYHFMIILNKTVYGQHLKVPEEMSVLQDLAASYRQCDNRRLYRVFSVCRILWIVVLFDLNTVQPSSLGNMYELYAIAGCGREA